MTPTEQRNGANGTLDSYTKTLHIHAAPHALYEAITTVPGIKSWWATDTAADNDAITVRFGEENFQTLRLVDPVPDERVVWEWVAQHFPIEGTAQTDEWVGTTITFEIQATPDGSSTLVFTHVGLTPHLVCYDLCNAGWNYYVGSLQRYLEEGTGTPSSRNA